MRRACLRNQDYIDGKITDAEQQRVVEGAFKRISDAHDFTVVEGTGHCGVGSIVNMNNAQVPADCSAMILRCACRRERRGGVSVECIYSWFGTGGCAS